MAKVLIADDNQQIASILEEYLKSEGHTPYVARDGPEALDLFASVQPDAVLLDVMMPDGRFCGLPGIRRQSACL